MWQREYATYNVEFTAVIAGEPSQMGEFNCCYAEGRRFGFLFDWFRVTQHCG